MVDWSASSRPTTGSDSIWYCLITRTGTSLHVVALENPSTRVAAMAEIRNLLCGLARQERTVLVGFDFPFGYPAGFADALRLEGDRPWDRVWSELVRSIVDRADNSNNRFEVAGELNRRLSGACYLVPETANALRCHRLRDLEITLQKDVLPTSAPCNRFGSCTGMVP